MEKMSDRSLEQLEGKWKTEIKVDDIRFMIVQSTGLEFLVSIALDLLKENILTEGNYYEGDLLNSVLMVPKSFWESNPNLCSQLYQILMANKDALSGLNPVYEADRNLLLHYDQFLKIHIKP